MLICHIGSIEHEIGVCLSYKVGIRNIGWAHVGDVFNRGIAFLEIKFKDLVADEEEWLPACAL